MRLTRKTSFAAGAIFALVVGSGTAFAATGGTFILGKSNTAGATTTLTNNPVLAARYAHLTGRADNKLTKTQARVAVAGSLLRQLHAVITTGTAWDPAIAGGLKPQSRGCAKKAAAAA